jgi:RND family efflux transporter MFP subunit
MKRALSALLPTAIIVGGVATAYVLVETGPQAAPVETELPATFIEVQNVEIGAHQVVVPAMGLVRAEREVVLQPEVAGRVVEQNEALVPGGRMAAGDPLIRIDARDYKSAVAAGQAELAQAQLMVREERTLKQVAEHEWRERPQGFSEETLAYALREPHLDAARAQVDSAKSRIAKARRDLERTIVRAPFDAVVLTESVDVGQSVAPGAPVATLAGIERYWVQVSLPVSHLQYIDIPGVSGDGPRGSPARVIGESEDPGQEREGYVLRLQGSVDTRGRMAQVFLAVDDPLGVHAPIERRPTPLLLGSYVRVEIHGRMLQNVVEVPRRAIRDNGMVWVLDEESRLRSRPVEIAWRESDRVLVAQGLAAGDRLVVTPLPAATEGMKVVLEGPP